MYILIYTQKQQKTIGSQRFFYPEKLTGPRCLVRERVRRVDYRRNPPEVPPLSRAGLESQDVDAERVGYVSRLRSSVGALTHTFLWGHGTAPREFQTFAGMMLATRSRLVRARHTIEGPTAPSIRRDRLRARTKKRRVNARVKVRECSRMYRPPNPPEKFKTNLSVWLARLKPPRTIWRLCSPHCSPEVNPVDAIARAVLGSVCLLDEFPECLARS